MNVSDSPIIAVIGGPNGAGKSTIARWLLGRVLGVSRFVNADVIAQGLSAFAPERSALAAGRIMLTQMRELASRRDTFAFETTLASRMFAPWLASLAATGYEVHLIMYVWVSSPQIAVDRVRARVREGGHGIAEDVVRRRFQRSASNLFRLYMPLAESWRVYDNSGSHPKLVARRLSSGPVHVEVPARFKELERLAYGQAQADDMGGDSG